jgi:Ca2+-binding RTX toxin-like protein
MIRSIARRRYLAPLLVVLYVLLPLSGLAASKGQVLTAENAAEGAISVPDTNGAPVTVIGNGSIPVRVWFTSNWTHKFTVDPRGTVTLEEQHGTGQKTTMTNVPVVYFSDGVGILLPSLKPTDAPLPGEASAATTSFSAIVRTPSLPKPVHPGEIVSVVLRNDTANVLPSRIVTFGQAFVQGDVKDGYTLEAAAGNQSVPLQADIKVRYADRSVRHAIISLEAPALAPSATLAIMLSARQGSAATSTPITPKAILASDYDLSMVREFTSGGGLPPLSVDARRALAAGAADGSITTWLSGPLASEYRVAQRIVPNMAVTFDIRTTADGSIMTDVSMANDFAYLFPEASIYSATVTQTGMPSWKSPVIAHHKFQEWHKVFWNKDTPFPSVIFDIDYLERAAAIPNYDLSSGLSRTKLTQSWAALSKADTQPLGAALITKLMGTTGGRDDIGPTTNWVADYLVSQDPAARTVMLAQADAAGSIPWHVREIDGRMVTAESHPLLWLDYRCHTADCLPGGYADIVTATGWGPEQAHEPDLAYVPYLTTGSHFYLDQLQSEANWLVLAQNPDYRRGATGLIYPANQVRGTAWNLRDIGNAAWISPDEDPNRPYFEKTLNSNMNGLQELYLTQRTMRQYGSIEGFIEFNHETIGPWQQDFLALTLTQLAFRGNDSGDRLARWMQNFIAGRFIHGADGYDPLRGPGYYLACIDPQSKLPVTSWAGLYELNFAGKPAPTELDGGPVYGSNYAAVARSATASLFSLTQDPRALRAYAFIVSNAEKMLRDFPNGNAFNINPRLPDGHVLQNDEIQFVPQAGGRVLAKTEHSLLIDNGAHAATLQGAKGVSILFGGTGPSTMIGAQGANYFFAGTGDATLAGAPGKSYFGLTAGKAQIDLAANDAALDRIEGFKPGRHHIHLIGPDTELGKIIASAQKVADGTLITVGPAHTIEFVGLAPSDLSLALFN